MTNKIMVSLMLIIAVSANGRVRSQDEFVSNRSFEAGSSRMVLLEKRDGSLWLLKQRRGNSLAEQLQCVKEIIGAHMAKFLEIPCNEVQLVAWNAYTEHKHFKSSPATLHTFIPGQTGCHFRPHVRIKQPVGSRCKRTCGLSKDVIESMTRHPTLPLLVALDTFIGAPDRGCPNFMYDRQTDEIYGIDFNSGFQQNLADLALHNLKEIEQAAVTFSHEELNALTLYFKALERLVKRYNPKDTFTWFVDVARQAGFFAQKRLRDELEHRLKKHKNAIRQSYQSSKRLVHYLEGLLAAGRSRAPQSIARVAA